MSTQGWTILRPSTIGASDRGGGARTIPLVTRATGSTTFMSGITIFAPGASIPVHVHDCEESVCLLEGYAIAEVDGVENSIVPGDVTFISPGIPHRFINASASEEMRIMWTYASVDATRTIVATRETHPIDSEHLGPEPGRRP